MSAQKSAISPHAASPRIFVSLMVKDIPRSIKFFTDLGYQFNTQFAGPTSACLIIGENINCMLSTEEGFKRLLGDAFAKANLPRSGWFAISCSSRQEVDKIVTRAVELGGKTIRPPQDLGFMYSHAYVDLDGHAWQYHCMDPAQLPK